MLQQAVGEIIKIVEAFAQIAVCLISKPRPRVIAYFFDRRLGRETIDDGLIDAGQPAGIFGKHFVGFQDIAMFTTFGDIFGFQHFIDGAVHFSDCPVEPLLFSLRIIRHEF